MYLFVFSTKMWNSKMFSSWRTGPIYDFFAPISKCGVLDLKEANFRKWRISIFVERDGFFCILHKDAKKWRLLGQGPFHHSQPTSLSCKSSGSIAIGAIFTPARPVKCLGGATFAATHAGFKNLRGLIFSCLWGHSFSFSSHTRPEGPCEGRTKSRQWETSPSLLFLGLFSAAAAANLKAISSN